MGCVLRVYGQQLNMSAQLTSLGLKPVVTWEKGQERLVKGRFHSDSGANFIVSDAEVGDFCSQMADAEAYLTENRHDILKLTSASGIEAATLDFAVVTRRGFVTHTSTFSTAFLQTLAELKLGLAVSHYPTEDE